MPKLPAPHPDTPTVDRLIEALGALTADTPRRFGTMDAAAMLEHCARFVDLYLGRVRVGAPIRFAARALGPLFLKRILRGSPAKTPRNLRTLGSLKVEGPDGESSRASFEAARERLRAGFADVTALEGEVRHVLYGRMDASAVRDLVRHHTAHHFHQFGLLGGD
ncbi:MAG: DinB family protein [Planctomycetota bacterium]